MLMGRLLHNTKNSWSDYVSALVMVAGIAVFSFANSKGGGGEIFSVSEPTSLAGAAVVVT